MSYLIENEDAASQEWCDKYDREAAAKIIKEHGIDGDDVPEEADIRRRLEEHRRLEFKIDADAGAWVYMRYLEAQRDDEDLAKLITEAYLKRVKRVYTAKAPFSAFLIGFFDYDAGKAAKIGVYLRAALHRGWSVPTLHNDMSYHWHIKSSTKEAQDYLVEQGVAYRRTTFGTASKSTNDNSTPTKSGKAVALAHTDDDDITLAEPSLFDDPDDFEDSAKAPFAMVDGSSRVDLPPGALKHLRQGKRVLIEFKMDKKDKPRWVRSSASPHLLKLFESWFRFIRKQRKPTKRWRLTPKAMASMKRLRTMLKERKVSTGANNH